MLRSGHHVFEVCRRFKCSHVVLHMLKMQFSFQMFSVVYKVEFLFKVLLLMMVSGCYIELITLLDILFFCEVTR